MFSQLCYGQNEDNRFEKLKSQLDLRIAENPGLEEPVKLSVSETPLAEFLRALALNNDINMSVANDVKGSVSNTFNRVTVSEVLLFLARQKDLTLEFTGSIIHVKPYKKPPPIPKINIPKSLKIHYDTANALLSMELRNDSLSQVTKTLTRKTTKNVLFAPGLERKLISIYLEEVTFDKAMDKMAFANNLIISKTEDGFYLIEAPEKNGRTKNGKDNQLRFLDLNDKSRPQFKVDSNLISLVTENRPLNQIVRSLFQNLDIDYFLYGELSGYATLDVHNVNLHQLLNRLFAGTEFTFKEIEGTYLIGNRKMESLIESRRITLKNRSVETVISALPKELTRGVEIIEFEELNSLLVSGSYPQILEIEKFLSYIDKPVPVVIIEVVIVDYQRNATVSAGIEAGIGQEPRQSGGSIYPGIDYTLNANSINDLIESFDGFGSLNLGPVSPNFYANLKLLETNGFINVRSTPKLSTLNGHEASISIGNTEYFVVEQTNVTGVQNPLPITTRNFQSVQANFQLTIKPIVSSNDQVTLNIQVEQSDFTTRISPDAPPGSVSRNFTSMIRVQNNDMILLGGLEEKGYDDSGSGVPLLARIPVIKWLFSSRTKSSNKSKLNVFIKPTIIK